MFPTVVYVCLSGLYLSVLLTGLCVLIWLRSERVFDCGLCVLIWLSSLGFLHCGLCVLISLNCESVHCQGVLTLLGGQCVLYYGLGTS